MGKAERSTLQILRENGEAYQSDIVRATGFSKATVSEVIKGLEKKRLVRRSKVGRNSKIVMIEAGRRPANTLRLGFTRATEYAFLVPLKKALREDGIALEFKVYDNGVSVARDLSLLRIDLGIAPTLTLFMSHSLDSPFKIIGPAGSGGSSILESPRHEEKPHGSARGVCTRMSTMELLMRSAINRHIIPDMVELAYAASPDEMSMSLMDGSSDVCSIWEPYATMLEAKGAKRLLRYSDISDHVCCAVAAGNHLERALVSKLSNRCASSMAALRGDADSFTAAYSALAGLESSTLRRVSREYSYPAELSGDSVARQLEAAGLNLPSPSSFRDAMFRE